MQEAINHLQQAIKINPEFANAHYQLALLLDKKNDFPYRCPALIFETL